jgi:hypothetical protein
MERPRFESGSLCCRLELTRCGSLGYYLEGFFNTTGRYVLEYSSLRGRIEFNPCERLGCYLPEIDLKAQDGSISAPFGRKSS